jgi:hypothetical protein
MPPIQARAAAHNMAGGASVSGGSLADQRARYPGPDLHQLRPVAGVPAGEGGEGAETGGRGAQRLPLLQFQGDILIGATSIGWTEHVGALRGLVQTRALTRGLEGAPAGRVRPSSWWPTWRLQPEGCLSPWASA